jgi:HrpA-like RNA helicase
VLVFMPGEEEVDTVVQLLKEREVRGQDKQTAN